MEILDMLREIMREKYGIQTEADLLKAVEDYPGPDLGIFVMPVREDVGHAV